MNFAVPVDHKVKWKESEKRDKYKDLAREQKQLLNMKVIPNVIGALGIIFKWLLKGLEDLKISEQMETIQTTALRSARILRRDWETWGNSLSLKLLSKTISKRSCEKPSKEWNNNNNNNSNFSLNLYYGIGFQWWLLTKVISANPDFVKQAQTCINSNFTSKSFFSFSLKKRLKNKVSLRKQYGIWNISDSLDTSILIFVSLKINKYLNFDKIFRCNKI